MKVTQNSTVAKFLTSVTSVIKGMVPIVQSQSRLAGLRRSHAFTGKR